MQNRWPKPKVRTMKGRFVGFLTCFLCFAAGIRCLPLEENNYEVHDEKFIGKATNDIATALLQGYAEKVDNMAYSPFGFCTLLAVFSEGARGSSREEIATALYFPKDVQLVRGAYKNLLQRFVEKSSNSPEFKNWFYIFKNYTVHEELQNVLRQYYLTEVKYVDRPIDYVKQAEGVSIEDRIKENKKKAESEKTENLPVEEAFTEDDGHLEANEKFKTSQTTEGTEKRPLDNEEKAPEKEEKEEEKDTSDNEGDVSVSVEVAKSTENLEKKSKQMSKESESPEKISGNPKTLEKPVETSTTEGSGDAKLPETMPKEDVNVVKPENKDENDEKTKVTSDKHKQQQEPDKKDENMIEEDHKEFKPTEEKDPIRVSTGMGPSPIEHLSGMTDSAIKVKGKDEAQPQMIVFNGMYYKGEWETPFFKKPADSSRVFYKSENEKVFVATIHSEGYYNTSSIPNLDCQALELPYKGGRYSLLVLVPNSRNGLSKLISDLSVYPLSKIYDELTEKLVDVSLPTFEINTISKPITSFKKLGVAQSVKTIFDPDTADLSGISAEGSSLFVDELVQMVTFKVDAEYTKSNFLTASIGYSRSNVPSFQVNQPFLFYLRDKTEDLTIVNGKVVDPTPRPSFYFS